MMKHTIDFHKHPIKQSFLDCVHGHLDDRLIEQYQEEYVLEAEHQDGIGFWDNFADASEVIEDFKRFVAFAEECEDLE
jgi:hypothetical protein